MRPAFPTSLLAALRPGSGLHIHLAALSLTLLWFGWMVWLSCQPVDLCARTPGLEAISGTLPLKDAPPCCAMQQAQAAHDHGQMADRLSLPDGSPLVPHAQTEGAL
jgi:hypothetical protein